MPRSDLVTRRLRASENARRRLGANGGGSEQARSTSEQTEVVRSKLGAPRSKGRWFGASSEHLGGQWRSERIGALRRGSGCARACLCVRAPRACRVRDCASVRRGVRVRTHTARTRTVHTRTLAHAGVHMCACGAVLMDVCARAVPLRVCVCWHACMLTWVCVCACMRVHSHGCAFLMCDLSLGGRHCLSPGLGEARHHHGWVSVGGLGREG